MRAFLRFSPLVTLIVLCAFPVDANVVTLAASARFRVVSEEPVDPGAGEDVLRRLEAVYARVAETLGETPKGPAVVCHVYATLESKGLATGYTLPAHAFAGRGEVYAALEHGFDGALEQEAAGILVGRILERPRLDALAVGFSVYFAGAWRGRSGVEWADQLYAGVSDAQARNLFDNRRFHQGSDLVGAVLACGFVAHAIETYGIDVFLRAYAEWDGTGAAVDRWVSHVRASARPRRAISRYSGPYIRGFCHAHEGYNITDGYVSLRSDEALAKLAEIGANAVSITPFSYMSRADRPAVLRFSSGANQESDESVVHATLAAKARGLEVMIKPHLWVRGDWPGAVEMTSDADWELFFEYYYDWMLHYALLGEMCAAEILCVGVELSRATVGREARWREMFQKLRGVFSGKLTYAANWGSEFESVEFWDALDLAGVNCYYPLSESEQPDDAELLAGARAAVARISQVAERHGIPVVLTEVGFTSARTPWIRPYERQRGSVVDEAAQVRCYEAMCAALSESRVIRGAYWWKWPSYLEYGGPAHTGFTPNGKAAEAVIRKWFSGSPN